jgi:hypothetical protein
MVAEGSNESSLDDNVDKSTFSVQKGDEMVAALDYFSGSGMGANYLSYVLCITFGMEAISIGYNLAITPLFITEQFGKGTAVIGIVLAAGAGFGTLFSILITFTKKGHALMGKYLPSPYNFFIAMGGISVSVLLASVPSFPVHVIGLLFLMGFNDIAALILNEMQGTITTSRAYSRTIGPMGQVVRRSGNVASHRSDWASSFQRISSASVYRGWCGDGSVDLGGGDCNQASNEVKPQLVGSK